MTEREIPKQTNGMWTENDNACICPRLNQVALFDRGENG
jgi:hypothetical protein